MAEKCWNKGSSVNPLGALNRASSRSTNEEILGALSPVRDDQFRASRVAQRPNRGVLPKRSPARDLPFGRAVGPTSMPTGCRGFRHRWSVPS